MLNISPYLAKSVSHYSGKKVGMQCRYTPGIKIQAKTCCCHWQKVLICWAFASSSAQICKIRNYLNTTSCFSSIWISAGTALIDQSFLSEIINSRPTRAEYRKLFNSSVLKKAASISNNVWSCISIPNNALPDTSSHSGCVCQSTFSGGLYYRSKITWSELQWGSYSNGSSGLFECECNITTFDTCHSAMILGMHAHGDHTQFKLTV